MGVTPGDQGRGIAGLNPSGVAPVLFEISLKLRRLIFGLWLFAKQPRHVAVKVDELLGLGLPLQITLRLK